MMTDTELLDFMDRHGVCVVRRVGVVGKYERIAYVSGGIYAVGATVRDAVESLAVILDPGKKII